MGSWETWQLPLQDEARASHSEGGRDTSWIYWWISLPRLGPAAEGEGGREGGLNCNCLSYTILTLFSHGFNERCDNPTPTGLSNAKSCYGRQ